MTLEALSILVNAILISSAVAVQASYAALTAGLTAGLTFGFSNRDGAQPGRGPAGARIDKTLGNLKEGAIMYLPLALLAVGILIGSSGATP